MLNAQITAHVPQPLSATATVAATLTATDSHPRTHTLDTHTHAHRMGVSALQPGSLLPLTANKCFDIYCQPDSQTLFTSRNSLLSTPFHAPNPPPPSPFLLPYIIYSYCLLLLFSFICSPESVVVLSALPLSLLFTWALGVPDLSVAK